MKRRYKLLIIILLGIILTIFINSMHVTSKPSLVSLGDGLSIGMTPYNVVGTSFNDYLKDKLKIDAYNTEFSYSNQTIHELNEHITNNSVGKISKTPIKQTIAKASIITLAIGIDEFASKSLTEEISLDLIDTYLFEINTFLSSIREFYDKDILVLGLYPANNFSKKDAIEVNSKLKTLCGKHNAFFLDIIALSLHEEYYLQETSYYINYKAHKEISKELYLYIKK